MDLNEHTLTEAQRTLKRLGVTHVLLPGVQIQLQTSPSGPLDDSKPRQMSDVFPLESSGKQPELQPEAPLPLLLRSLFHGKHTPVRTLWTYAGLHLDMQEPDSPPRLTVFKKIQESVCLHLKWNPEKLCSWPLDLDSVSFRKGIEHFSPHTIIVFGSQKSQLEADHKNNLLIMERAGFRMVTLPDLDKMAIGDQQLKNEAWRILQTLPG